MKSETLMNSEMKRVTKARVCDCSVAAEGVTPSTVGGEKRLFTEDALGLTAIVSTEFLPGGAVLEQDVVLPVWVQWKLYRVI